MFSVVIDTCALYPAHLRDTLLRLAECELYRPLWSPTIHDELQRNLVDDGLADTAVEHLITEMARAFPDASVQGYEPLIPAMKCDDKDRHVLAAAVRSNAASIVTFNLADFPGASVEPFAIDVVHPDQFLLDLLDLAPATVADELEEQAAANRRAPRTLTELLSALAVAGAPAFADEIRRRRA